MVQTLVDTMATKKKTASGSSRDAVFGGRLIINQPSAGYRFSIDSILLTAFSCQGRRPSTTVDLGAGSGVVGLGLLAAGWSTEVIAVEVQRDLADLAVRNAVENGLESAYRMIVADARQDLGIAPGSIEMVVMNPPFWPADEGRLPDNEERRVACHEILGGIDEWMAAAARLLKSGRGRLAAVFPARRMDSLILAMGRSSLSASRMRLVHPRIDAPAELFLVEARMGKPGRLVVEKPLVLKEQDDSDTEEAALLMEGGFSNELKNRPDMRVK